MELGRIVTTAVDAAINSGKPKITRTIQANPLNFTGGGSDLLKSNLVDLSCKPVSVSDIKTITAEEGKKLVENLQHKNFKSFNSSRPVVDFEIQGVKYKGNFLGCGGSKSAYKVLINNEEACLLCPSGDFGWLHEPQNVYKLKALGLLTNDYSKLISVTVDEVTFPAILTKPYDKHNFKIFDLKNANDYLEKYIPPYTITEENLPELVSEIVKNAKNIANNHIVLGDDCINLALKDGKLRLFLNDLPYDNMVDKTFSREKLAMNYLTRALDGIQARYSIATYNKYPILQKLGDFVYLQNLSKSLLNNN